MFLNDQATRESKPSRLNTECDALSRIQWPECGKYLLEEDTVEVCFSGALTIGDGTIQSLATEGPYDWLEVDHESTVEQTV